MILFPSNCLHVHSSRKHASTGCTRPPTLKLFVSPTVPLLLTSSTIDDFIFNPMDSINLIRNNIPCTQVIAAINLAYALDNVTFPYWTHFIGTGASSKNTGDPVTLLIVIWSNHPLILNLDEDFCSVSSLGSELIPFSWLANNTSLSGTLPAGNILMLA